MGCGERMEGCVFWRGKTENGLGALILSQVCSFSSPQRDIGQVRHGFENEFVPGTGDLEREGG